MSFHGNSLKFSSGSFIYYLINHTLFMSTLFHCSAARIQLMLLLDLDYVFYWLSLTFIPASLLSFHHRLSSLPPSPSAVGLLRSLLLSAFCSPLTLTLGEPIYSHSFKYHVYANDAYIYIFSPIFNQSKSSLITKSLFPAFSCLLDTFSGDI